MRKLKTYFFVFIVLLGLLGISAQTGFAQDIGIDPAILDDPDVFTLKELGYTERYLVGPYDSQYLFFSIPNHWRLTAGTYIELEFSYAFGGARGIASQDLLNTIGGSLIVRYNNQLLNTVLLTNPEGGTIKLTIPTDAFVTDAVDGRHSISIFLDASLNCDIEGADTLVWIEPDSYIKFVYDEVAPMNDLQDFPRPFYLPDAIVPAEVAVVIPDNPTADDVQAGMSIVSGLGSITNGQSLVTMQEWGAVTEETKADKHLIFVGTVDKFPDLQGLNFPVTISGGKHSLPESVADNGVIETVVSPWNPIKMLMFISGNSSEAVDRAARAVSSGTIVTSGLPNLSLVSGVSSSEAAETPIIDQTLSDMGIETSTLGVYGNAYFEMKFNATAEQARSTGAYLELVMTRSNLLNFSQSGVTIFLNDTVIGTIGFEEGESTVVTERFELLPNFVQRGENVLAITTSLIPYDLCYTSDLESTWVTISDTSYMHLPISERQISIGDRLDLSFYPTMFQGDPRLGNLAFVLPKGNSAAIESAAQIAFYIGNQATIDFANFDVYYADEVSNEQLAEKNLIFVGRSTEFPQMSDINDLLPVSFDEGSDLITFPALPVNYSVLPDVGVGYTQLLASPWNGDNALLVVAGNLDSGLALAKNALSDDVLVGELVGNFATIFDNQVLSMDTRIVNSNVVSISESTDNGSGDGGETTVQPLPTATPVTVEARPAWLVPSILVTSALMLLLIVIAAFRSSKKH